MRGVSRYRHHSVVVVADVKPPTLQKLDTGPLGDVQHLEAEHSCRVQVVVPGKALTSLRP